MTADHALAGLAVRSGPSRSGTTMMLIVRSRHPRVGKGGAPGTGGMSGLPGDGGFGRR